MRKYLSVDPATVTRDLDASSACADIHHPFHWAISAALPTHTKHSRDKCYNMDVSFSNITWKKARYVGV